MASALRQPDRVGLFFTQLFVKVSAFVHWFDLASPEIKEILVDCTDGEGPSNAPYGYSVNRAGTTGLPDVYFTRSRGYAEFDERFRALAIPWAQRHDKIVWRGSPTGMGHFNLDPAFINHPGVSSACAWRSIAATLRSIFALPRCLS